MSGTIALETQLNDPLLYMAPLPYVTRIYPYGFPVEVASDSRQVIDAAREGWGMYTPLFDTPPIRVHVLVSEGGARPPAPWLVGQRHLLTWVSDPKNFSTCDRLQRFGYCCVTEATVADRVFFRWHFLDAVIYMLLELSCFTSVHAACVARDGAGVLLFGESGVGKSTLAYACARSGWTYISDDASAVVWGRRRTVTGEPHHFRFRAEAPEIFPELRGLTVGYQLDRKPTIEVYTASLPIRTAQECRVEWMVFVERGPGGTRCIPISRQAARERLLRDMPNFDPALQDTRMDVVEALLEAPAFELRYSGFEEAVPLLEDLVRTGKIA